MARVFHFPKVSLARHHISNRYVTLYYILFILIFHIYNK